MENEMSEDTNITETLKAILAGQQGASGAGLPGWGTQTRPTPTGVSIPIKVPTPLGSVRVDMHFGAEHATPQGIEALLQSLVNAGVPVDAWQPRSSWGNSNGGGGYRRGGGRW
jgi:hypothetical protein